MTMERVLWFDERVRAGDHPGSATIAAHFNVSSRTARRDIEFLRDRLRAPLRFDAAARGYAYTDPGFCLPQAFFRKDEMIALVYARHLFRKMRGGKVRNARIRFGAGRAGWASAQPWPANRRLQMELDGSAVLELPEARVLEVFGLVLQLGGDVVVLAPAELRDWVRSEIDRLRAVYPERAERRRR